MDQSYIKRFLLCSLRSVGQLCINQGDIMEKNSQVQLMPSIYEKAENVVIWLGEASHDSVVGIQILKYC